MRSKAGARRTACIARSRSIAMPIAPPTFGALAQNAPFTRRLRSGSQETSCPSHRDPRAPSGGSPPPISARRTAGPGRLLLAAVIGIELSIVAITVLLNQWNKRFYNALQDRNWDSFVSELLLFLRAGGGLHRARGLSALPQPMAADPLAALDDRPLSRSLAEAAIIIACSCSATTPTIRTSASPRTFGCSSRAHLIIGIGLLSVDRDARFLRGDPVDAVGGSAAASVRRDLGDPRLSRLGRAHLRGARHRR